MEAFDLQKHEEEIDKLIAREYQSSYMSNAKWRKLYSALDIDEIVLDQILLKRVDREEPYISYMPKNEDIENLWVSEGENDCNYFYKEIEWLELLKTANPSDIPSQYYPQSIELAELIIKDLGHFEVEKTETGLKIYGYKT